jgi:hypothetical protein
MKMLGLAAALFIAYAIGFSVGVTKGHEDCVKAMKRVAPPDAARLARLTHPSRVGARWN